MTPTFSLDVYRERRARYLAGLGNVALILPASPLRNKTADQEYAYRASSDLLYLTGFGEPEAYAVITCDGDPARHELTLFVRPRNPEREQWEGRRAGVDGALAAFGADHAFAVEELGDKLPDLLSGRDAIHFTLNHHRRAEAALFRALGKLAGGRGKPRTAPDVIVDPRRKLHDQRRVKAPEEVELLRRVTAITAEAHAEAMKSARPGQYEYEVAARVEYVFRTRGAAGPGFDTIVGGGVNATILHYTSNDCVLRDGDLVLIDAGAELAAYNGDITRTFPVGRAFTAAQRDVYQAVLDVQHAAIAKIAPGASAQGMTEWSRRATTEALVGLGLLSGDVDQLVEDGAYKRFYMHNLGHYLGMDVHDVGTYLVAEGEPLPLEPGVVLTVEPGIYIPTDEDIPEAFRGIGVRIEDDVLLTADGCEVLTGDAPKAVDEIEALRRDVLGP
jgi:Xaa-Pro aminopeptidase